jgi:hypothetical protein
MTNEMPKLLLDDDGLYVSGRLNHLQELVMVFRAGGITCTLRQKHGSQGWLVYFGQPGQTEKIDAVLKEWLARRKGLGEAASAPAAATPPAPAPLLPPHGHQRRRTRHSTRARTSLD